MSIVCCKVYKDRIEIASDSITVRGYTQSKGKNLNFSKLVKVDDIIIGGVGYAEENSLFQIFCQTHKPNEATENDLLIFMSEFSDWKRNKTDSHKIENQFIFIYKRKAFAIENYLIQEIIDYEAIGAGMDYALSALYLKYDVDKAVDAACELSIYCEKPIVKYTVEKISK